MFFTACGISMEVRPLHLEKAHSPMVVTDSGRVMEVNSLQYSKAQLPMAVTELGILTFSFLSGHFDNTVWSLLYNAPSTDE